MHNNKWFAWIFVTILFLLILILCLSNYKILIEQNKAKAFSEDNYNPVTVYPQGHGVTCYGYQPNPNGSVAGSGFTCLKDD